jgi:SAM-dependent methyltransferase
LHEAPVWQSVRASAVAKGKRILMSPALYDRIGVGYAQYRQPDERIARWIDGALGESRSVLNVGAGTGSYEPSGRFVIAAEPSAEMIRQRSRTAAQSIRAWADRLPFRDGSFDASLAILTIHHWLNRDNGLTEMRRVARDWVVIFTWDPEHPGFWLVQDYFPDILNFDRRSFPSLHDIAKAIGPVEVLTVPVPADCTDGFLGAYWRRPDAYLNPRVRAAISTFSRFDSTAGVMRLQRDLEDGTWNERYGALLALQELDIGYRVVLCRCS